MRQAFLACLFLLKQILIYAIGFIPNQKMLIINGKIKQYSNRLKGVAHDAYKRTSLLLLAFEDLITLEGTP